MLGSLNNIIPAENNRTKKGNTLESMLIIGGIVLAISILSSLWFTIKLFTAAAIALMFFQLGKTSYKLLSETFFNQNSDKNKNRYVNVAIAGACLLTAAFLFHTMLYTSFTTTLVFCATLIFLEHGNNCEISKYADKFSDEIVKNIRDSFEALNIPHTTMKDTVVEDGKTRETNVLGR